MIRACVVAALLFAATSAHAETLQGRLEGDTVRCEVDLASGEATVTWRGWTFTGVSKTGFVGRPVIIIPLRRVEERSAVGASGRLAQLEGTSVRERFQDEPPRSLTLAVSRNTNPTVGQFVLNGRIANRVAGRRRRRATTAAASTAAGSDALRSGQGEAFQRALREFLSKGRRERSAGLAAIAQEHARLERELEAAAKVLGPEIDQTVDRILDDHAARILNLREGLWEGSRRDAYQRQIQALAELASQRSGEARRAVNAARTQLEQAWATERQLYRQGEFEALDRWVGLGAVRDGPMGLSRH